MKWTFRIILLLSCLLIVLFLLFPTIGSSRSISYWKLGDFLPASVKAYKLDLIAARPSLWISPAAYRHRLAPQAKAARHQSPIVAAPVVAEASTNPASGSPGTVNRFGGRKTCSQAERAEA